MSHPEQQRSAGLELEEDYLRRVVEHANEHHGEELRIAVANRTGQRARQVVAAQLLELTPRSVELQWVTLAGGHRTVLRFPYVASSAEQLGAMLQRALHPGLC